MRLGRIKLLKVGGLENGWFYRSGELEEVGI